ncbi:alkaline phosphatase PhoX [Haloglycomyces albus]|uniref:alkaline phosphatase PhoX n=1 Tax=Haloglycomyces albus TaxID=526067 RepID=UPI00046C933E|nr:alkaline phosphatase PhoX [Haloglycomyces albus]
MGNNSASTSRRRLLQGTAAAGMGVFAVTAMEGFTVRAADAAQGRPPREAEDNGGYGPLRPVTRTDPETGFQQTLELPEGFDFTLLSLSGTALGDNHMTPLGPDAMACFEGVEPGTVRLVRNHEERTDQPEAVPSGDLEYRYDPKGSGGTSTLVVQTDGSAPTVTDSWMSLSGTIVNCAGGPTPWGSWLSCEETTSGYGDGWDRKHGYVFEVPAHSDHQVDPIALTDMGRFVHEAVAIDPESGYVYETEDRGAAGFYRFLPHTPGQLAEGGRLQMLKVVDEWQYDTRTGQHAARPLAVEWVDIDDPDPAEAEENSSAVYEQGHAQGAATFGRLEGCWWGGGAAYIASTNGGDEGQGQIWEYRPGKGNGRMSGGTLRLVFESPDSDVLSFPDNVTVTPSGALILCEDTSRSRPALRGLTHDGRVFPFCLDPSNDEWCGATFSPNGEILFANLQGSTSGDPAQPSTRGRTVAIWGPWENGLL